MSPTVAAQPPVALTLRLYRALARSFPQEFQNIYGEDLLRDAEDMVEPVWRRHGIAGLIRLLLDIAVRVPAEYFAEFRRDVRQGVRILMASPGFTLVALVSLILGIGTASAAYSEFKAVLRDLPGVRNPGELIAVQAPVSYPAYTRHRELRDLFSQTLAYVPAVRMVVSMGAGKERSWGHLVTPSYFATFGLKPHLGRFFHAGDDKTGVSPAVVVSYRFWEEHLGSDPLAVGKVLRINSHPCTVVGVGPEQFQGASPAAYVADLWLPVHSGLAVAPEMEPGSLERRDLAMFQMVARLRPGVSHAAAEAALTASARQFAEFYGDLGRHEKQPYMAVVEGGKWCR